MLSAQILLSKISEKVAILRTELNQNGSLGLTDIHKCCENFVERLLNLVYNYQLINLNEGKMNFPGLDLGDISKGIAYQVSSTKTSEKINEMLSTVMNNKLYETFQDIRMFVLSGKQSSYSITVATSPHFEFNWKEKIFDLGDVLQDIQHLPPAAI